MLTTHPSLHSLSLKNSLRISSFHSYTSSIHQSLPSAEEFGRLGVRSETSGELTVRSNLVGNAGSRPISEAKQPWACPVLGWGTTGEAHVLYSISFILMMPSGLRSARALCRALFALGCFLPSSLSALLFLDHLSPRIYCTVPISFILMLPKGLRSARALPHLTVFCPPLSPPALLFLDHRSPPDPTCVFRLAVVCLGGVVRFHPASLL